MKQGEEEEMQSKSNGGKKGKTQDKSKARKASKCVSARKKRQRRRGRREQTSQRRQEDWQRHKQVEEMQASSKGEMRGVGRTRLAGKGKERATDVKVSMKAKEEDLAAKENNKRRGRRKAKTTERNRLWAEWRLTWGLVAYTPGHIGPREGRRKGRDRKDEMG